MSLPLTFESLFQYLITMFLEVDKYHNEPTGTIKCKRNKSLKVVEQTLTRTLFVKLMTFSLSEPIEWLEQEILNRVNTLREIHQISPFLVREKKLLEVNIKKTTTQKTIYLTTPYKHGLTLQNALVKQIARQLLKPQKIKYIIWQIMSLLLAGKGFTNVIITAQNLFLEARAGDKLQPTVNYCSFAGYRFLKAHTEIDLEQYLEIAMFLDEEVLKTGDMDRFQFKIRNFACLLLYLICGKDPNKFIFHKMNLEAVISIERARELQATINLRIRTLINSKMFKENIRKLNIIGLEDFIFAVFSQPSADLDWTQTRKHLLGKFHSLKKSSENTNKQTLFQQLGHSLWNAETLQQHSLFGKRGMSLHRQEPEIYLGVKMSLNLQIMLKQNNWQTFLLSQQYSRQSRQMFYRFLNIFEKAQLMEENPQSFRSLASMTFQAKQTVDSRNIVMLPYERRIFLSYPNF